MRKIYIAKRIASNTLNDVFIETNTDMDVDDLIHTYKSKKIDRGTYIHNGHWILRSVSKTDVLEENDLPSGLKPEHIMEMVFPKLEKSDALVAIINGRAYGTIAELGYAVGTGKHAVYVLPDSGVDNEELEDLWMSFHMAFQTKHFWQDVDIQSVEEFQNRGIRSTIDYEKYILSITPKFLK